MSNYTLTNASDAARWIAGELLLKPSNATGGVTAEQLASLIEQCPLDDLIEEEHQIVADTVANGACLAKMAEFHDVHQAEQDAGRIASTILAWET